MSLKYAYVVFRSMEDLERVEKAYKINRMSKWCILKCCCFKTKKAEIKRKHFFKKWPSVSVSTNPDNIKWENLGYSGKSIFCRKLFM